MWHSAGAADRQHACVSVTSDWGFDPSMPEGWLMTSGGSFNRWVVAGIAWDTPPSPENLCGTTAAQGGARVVYWRPNEDYPATHSDYVCMWPQYEPLDQTTDHGWYYGLPWKSDGSGAPRDVYLKLDTIDYEALLDRYLPQLRFHFAESYRADSAWTATLPLPPFSGDPDRSNNLERENGAILAAADALLGYPQLRLDTLPARTGSGGELYSSGEPALDSDRIDFRNDTYQADAAAMHANSDLANRIYARATHDENGKVWLQYWFFYYYNDVPFPLIGDHEADWEMIQIGLNGSLTPDVASYAQHSGAESCPWARVPKYNGPRKGAPDDGATDRDRRTRLGQLARSLGWQRQPDQQPGRAGREVGRPQGLQRRGKPVPNPGLGRGHSAPGRPPTAARRRKAQAPRAATHCEAIRPTGGDPLSVLIATMEAAAAQGGSRPRRPREREGNPAAQRHLPATQPNRKATARTAPQSGSVRRAWADTGRFGSSKPPGYDPVEIAPNSGTDTLA
jgi:hypothetical protein